MPAKSKTNGEGGGENEDGSCHEDQEFCSWLLYILISCLLSITQMMLNGFDDYRSCVEE